MEPVRRRLQFILAAQRIGGSQETISISVPDEIKKELDRATREEGLSRSDLVRQAVRDYLFVRRFRALRAKMMAKAQADGVFTDDDVFRRVS